MLWLLSVTYTSEIISLMSRSVSNNRVHLLLLDHLTLITILFTNVYMDLSSGVLINRLLMPTKLYVKHLLYDYFPELFHGSIFGIKPKINTLYQTMFLTIISCDITYTFVTFIWNNIYLTLNQSVICNYFHFDV